MPRSKNDIDLEYSHLFIKSTSFLSLLTFRSQAATVSEKNPLFSHFPIEKLTLPNWPWRRIGQEQPRVTIYINCVKLEYPVLHAKFQDHRTSTSRGEHFYMFLPYMYMSMAAFLVM